MNIKPKRDENKTHCIRGHLLKGENLYLLKSGQKRCRTCHKENRIRRSKNKKKNEEGLF
jgi:hypothetical protein